MLVKKVPAARSLIKKTLNSPVAELKFGILFHLPFSLAAFSSFCHLTLALDHQRLVVQVMDWSHLTGSSLEISVHCVGSLNLVLRLILQELEEPRLLLYWAMSLVCNENVQHLK